MTRLRAATSLAVAPVMSRVAPGAVAQTAVRLPSRLPWQREKRGGLLRAVAPL